MALSTTTVNGTSLPGLLNSIGSSPIGVKATSPAANIPAPSKSLPVNQAIQPKDLSGSYANVNGTIYNKQTGKGYATPEEFFGASGVNNFNNLKFDTAWTPPKIAATPAAVSSTPPPVSSTPETPPPTATETKPYSPPNQGTTGVSQGGIIGNLLNTANNESPQVAKARADLSALEQDYGQKTADIDSRPMGLTQQTGQEGILARLFAAKQGALQTALSSALTSQGQSITANQAAGGLNAPITNPQTGGLVSPSSPGTTDGSSSSGALNPINNVASIAQQVVSGQISPSQAYAMGGTVANWQGLLNSELQKQQPGFDQSAAQAKYDANQSSQGMQAGQKAAYQSAYQQGQNLQSQLVDLLKSYNLNPNDVNALNSGIQAIAQNVSSPQYKALDNLVTDIVSTYSAILTPGSTTDTARATAKSLIDSTASGQSIIATLQALDQQAQAKIAGTQTPSTTGTGSSGGSKSKPSNNDNVTLGLF